MAKYKKEKLLTLTELSKLTEIRHSTLKYYALIGILKFKQKEAGLLWYFPEKKSVERVKEIRDFRENKRMTINEIIKHYKK